MENEINQVHKIKSLVLSWEAEWTIFVLNGSGLEDLSSTPPLKLLLSAPPPGGDCADCWHVLVWLLSKLLQERSLEILMGSSSSVFGIVQKQTGILWSGEFSVTKKICNITFSQHYELQRLHVKKLPWKLYGKSKLMQKCLKYMYKLSKKMHVFAHTTNTSCKVCIFSSKYQAS